MKILFAEDEPDLQDVVAEYLRYQGHTVTAVPNGQAAVEEALSGAYDALILDVMMPVMDGVTALRRIRASGNTVPALFLTAKAEIPDRVEGLDAGADDYITKPFSLEELAAHMRALNRRMKDYRTRTLTFADMVLDAEASELRARNTIGLALKEVRLLSVLMTHPDRPMSAEELLEEVWPDEDTGPDVVSMYMEFLRAKLQSVQASAVIEGGGDTPFILTEAPHV